MGYEFTIDRLKKLAKRYNVKMPEYCGELHELLDVFDRKAGIKTCWMDGHECKCTKSKWSCPGNHNHRRYVGARLALHEIHIGTRAPPPAPPSLCFWLGVEGNK